MAEFAKELVIFLNQHAPGNTYDAGKLHGRVAFEVASMLVGGELIGATKAGFYGKLATRLETKSFPLVEEARAATVAAKTEVQLAGRLGSHAELAAPSGMRPLHEAHHINQAAAFEPLGISYSDGKCLEMLARRTDGSRKGLPHYLFHRELDKFWKQFWKGGPREFESTTVGEYNQWLPQSFRAAGLSDAEAARLTAEAIAEQQAYGITAQRVFKNIPGARRLRPD